MIHNLLNCFFSVLFRKLNKKNKFVYLDLNQ